MLSDLDKIRTERRKAKANRNKYIGTGNDGGFGGGYGGYGNDSGYGGSGGYGGSSGKLSLHLRISYPSLCSSLFCLLTHHSSSKIYTEVEGAEALRLSEMIRGGEDTKSMMRESMKRIPPRAVPIPSGAPHLLPRRPIVLAAAPGNLDQCLNQKRRKKKSRLQWMIYWAIGATIPASEVDRPHPAQAKRKLSPHLLFPMTVRKVPMSFRPLLIRV